MLIFGENTPGWAGWRFTKKLDIIHCIGDNMITMLMGGDNGKDQKNEVSRWLWS